MPIRVSEFSLVVNVYARVVLPSYINLDPEEEGNSWWVKWDTLYYTVDGEVKDYSLGNLEYDGDYKRPEVEDVEEEKYAEEIPEDIEDAMEAWAEYQRNGDERSNAWIEAMEDKIALHHETMAEIARGK